MCTGSYWFAVKVACLSHDEKQPLYIVVSQMCREKGERRVIALPHSFKNKTLSLLALCTLVLSNMQPRCPQETPKRQTRTWHQKSQFATHPTNAEWVKREQAWNAVPASSKEARHEDVQQAGQACLWGTCNQIRIKRKEKNIQSQRRDTEFALRFS